MKFVFRKHVTQPNDLLTELLPAAALNKYWIDVSILVARAISVLSYLHLSWLFQWTSSRHQSNSNHSRSPANKFADRPALDWITELPEWFPWRHDIVMNYPLLFSLQLIQHRKWRKITLLMVVNFSVNLLPFNVDYETSERRLKVLRLTCPPGSNYI